MNLYYGSTNFYDGDDPPPNLCPHGVNLDEAGCGRCVEDNMTDWDEECGARPRMTRQERLQGLADMGIDTLEDYRGEK